jgi:hypothetical protein
MCTHSYLMSSNGSYRRIDTDPLRLSEELGQSLPIKRGRWGGCERRLVISVADTGLPSPAPVDGISQGSDAPS